MIEANGKKALHVATFSGWYRFEQEGKNFRQTKRDLTYWTLTCMSVDPDNPQKLYAGSEHSGLFYTENGGKCAAPDGNGMIAGTSDGSLLLIDDNGVREVVAGLPFVTSVELAA